MSTPAEPDLQFSRLRVSDRCCELFVSRGSVDVTIAELAAAADISQRTFHRYFPFKAESVGPTFDAMIRRSNNVIAEADEDRPLAAVLREAFSASLLDAATDRTRRLFPLVFGDREMWAVFLRKLHDGERSVAPILAPRLRAPEDSLSARAAAAAVASAIRIALEVMVTTGADPATTYAELLDEFTPSVLQRR
ncbi:TetR family transcriptional regulator [Microbacterium sp. NPDC058062]|uniref:TetR family transcriptional regulator n=1 Tax=Microbacterium sp. NPDC058062 TaxID=3346320 RepID=UPI0036DCE064